jgi:hypothetical protein
MQCTFAPEFDSFEYHIGDLSQSLPDGTFDDLSMIFRSI